MTILAGSAQEDPSGHSNAAHLDDSLAERPFVLTPHLGGQTQEALEKTGLQVAGKVLAHLRAIGESPATGS